MARYTKVMIVLGVMMFLCVIICNGIERDLDKVRSMSSITINHENIFHLEDFSVSQYARMEITKTTAVCFQDGDSSGCFKWDDIDGDKVPDFRWEGGDIEESAQMFFNYIKEIGYTAYIETLVAEKLKCGSSR